MSEALIRFFVIGEIPGTHYTIGYKTSLVIAGIFIMLITLYLTIRYQKYLARKINQLSPEKLIELITI